MIKCKDCKWWTLRRDGMDEDDPNPQFPVSTHKYCVSQKVNGGDLASISNYEAIGTGPEFGCIHGELKP